MLRRLGLLAVPVLCAVVALTAPTGAFAPERSGGLGQARLERVTAASAGSPTGAIRPDFACRKGQVSITFDDGPHATYTPHLLRILRREHAQATFFVTGSNAERYPAILRSILRDGHAIENHSWNHPVLSSMSKKAVSSQLRRTSAAIEEATGREPVLFRPPFGATSAKVRSAAKKLGLRQELWTIDTRDWAGLSTKQIRKRATKDLRPHRSNVILMHDAVTNSGHTLHAVTAIIRTIRSKGYCLVPLEVVTPPSRVRSGERTVVEPAEGSLPLFLHVWLDRRTPQRGVVRATLVDGTARAGIDYVAKSRHVTFGRGGVAHDFGMRVLANPDATGARYLWLRLDHPEGLGIATRKVRIVIRDAQTPDGSSSAQDADAWPWPRS